VTVLRQPRGTTFRYDFWFRGRRYVGSTHQVRVEDARAFERQFRVELARRGGHLPVRPEDTPTIQDWSEVYFDHLSRRIKRPDILERTLRVVLRFWGARPTKKLIDPKAPYHNLRLADPIENPVWIETFEHWMTGRTIGGATRNSYRSALRGMYRIAMLPQFRSATGMTTNPFTGIPKDRVVRWPLTLWVDQLRAWFSAAAPHVKLALAIGALAPKLRLTNILALRWDTSFDDDLRFITLADHKTDRSSGSAMVAPISPQLRDILTAARAASPGSSVIQFRGCAVGSLKTALRSAARRADMPYGLRARGATFHTLRHLAATMLAELRVPETIRKETMGHKEIRTTQIYTHLRPVHQIEPLEQLSQVTPLSDLLPLTLPRQQATKASGPRERS
jgi:integrase